MPCRPQAERRYPSPPPAWPTPHPLLGLQGRCCPPACSVLGWPGVTLPLKCGFPSSLRLPPISQTRTLRLKERRASDTEFPPWAAVL